MTARIIPKRNLGGTAKHIQVGCIGHGLMFLTWKPEHTPDKEAFESMKAAADAGATFWNSGNFYGMPDPLSNLKLLRRFFDAYPEYAVPGKIFLSIKGGHRPYGSFELSEAELREDLKRTIEALGPRKKMDLFQIARQTSPVEHTMPIIRKFVEEGLFNYIGLSEVSADSVRRAHAIYPVTVVEVECSLWALEDELYRVIKACEELDISLAAYSPLARGFLAGRFKSPDDIPEGDMRKHMPKFSPKNFPINLKLTTKLNKIAAKRSVPVTPAQLALAYVLQMSDKIIPIPGSSHIKRTLENINAAEVNLSKKELDEINNIVKQFPSPGTRYGGVLAKLVWL